MRSRVSLIVDRIQQLPVTLLNPAGPAHAHWVDVAHYETATRFQDSIGRFDRAYIIERINQHNIRNCEVEILAVYSCKVFRVTTALLCSVSASEFANRASAVTSVAPIRCARA